MTANQLLLSHVNQGRFWCNQMKAQAAPFLLVDHFADIDCQEQHMCLGHLLVQMVIYQTVRLL